MASQIASFNLREVCAATIAYMNDEFADLSELMPAPDFSTGGILLYDKEEMSKIFDRFYRTDPSRNSQTGGHGIGLSIAKAIVESHNGRLHAAVEPERVFRITASFIG